jgi:hypothetical protein
MRTRGWSAFRLAVASVVAAAGIATVAPDTAYAATCPTGPPVPGSALSGAAVISSTNAWAAGVHYDGTTNQTLTEHWNGTAWKVIASPSPGGTANPADLSGVAATSSTNAWAVGEYCRAPVYQTLVEHWNGTSWRQTASPSPGPFAHLTGVTATSLTNAWAVGSYETSTTSSATQKTLVEHWNGAAWKQVASPSPDASPRGGPTLNAVAATSPTNAWAVGNYYDPVLQEGLTLIEHWNGTRWLQVPSPNPSSVGINDLFGVSAVGTNNAWAVGVYHNGAAYQNLILHWNGAGWTQVPVPNPGGPARANFLQGVTATSTANAWAAGSYEIPSDGEATLTLHWNGVKWSQVVSPNVGATFPGDLVTGIAASPAATPWVTGTYCPTTGCPARHTLTLHWTGKSWVRVPSP